MLVMEKWNPSSLVLTSGYPKFLTSQLCLTVRGQLLAGPDGAAEHQQLPLGVEDVGQGR
jgi:hypothetical protein